MPKRTRLTLWRFEVRGSIRQQKREMQTAKAKTAVLLGVAGILSLSLGSGCGGGASGPASNISEPAKASTFTNPLLKQSAADPWIVRHDNYYLFTCTTSGREIQIWKSPTIEGLSRARKTTVWKAPVSGPNSRDVWAPEIHFLRGKWFIYYTATDGPDANRRLFVLEAKTTDPLGGYTPKAKLLVPGEGQDQYSIDADVFERGGALYLLWSGRESIHEGAQNIYIAPLSDPWTVSGPRVRLSSPQHAWECQGWPVNEGPQALQHNGQTFVVYSASGGSTPYYCLGMLSNSSGDLLSAAAWKKSDAPVFQSYEGADGHVYGVGHNSFTNSPDGSDWIVYHGKQAKISGWSDRLPRAQKFTWNAEGTPDFGHPIPSGVAMPIPR